MKKIILLSIFFLLIGCNSNVISSFKNNSISPNLSNSKFSSSSEGIIIKKELNYKGFGFEASIDYENRTILEEMNLNFYDMKNYKAITSFENFEQFKNQYILNDIDGINIYNQNYFIEFNAIVIYYIGSPTLVDSTFTKVEYLEREDNTNVYMTYASITGEGIPTIAVTTFNLFIIDLPKEVNPISITFNFIDLTK